MLLRQPLPHILPVSSKKMWCIYVKMTSPFLTYITIIRYVIKGFAGYLEVRGGSRPILEHMLQNNLDTDTNQHQPADGFGAFPDKAADFSTQEKGDNRRQKSHAADS